MANVEVCRVLRKKAHGKDLAHGKKNTICRVPHFLHTANILHTAKL